MLLILVKQNNIPIRHPVGKLEQPGFKIQGQY